MKRETLPSMTEGMNERDTKFGNKHNECCSTQTETHTAKTQKLEEEIECSKHLHAPKKNPSTQQLPEN